jgi:hypothetical protein
MKKNITVLTILGLVLAIVGALLAYFLAPVLKFYENPSAFLSIWSYVLQAFTFQNMNMGSIVFIAVLGTVIVLFILQLIFIIANKHPKALLVSLAWLLTGAIATAFTIIVFQAGFFKDVTAANGDVIKDTGFFFFTWKLRDYGILNVGTLILAYTPVALVLIGFILMLIAEIQDLVLIGQEPGTPKRDYAADLDNGNKVVVVREDKATEAPSSEEIRSMLRDELAGQKAQEEREHGHGEYPHAAAEQEYADRGGHSYNAPMAPMPPMGQTPIINGPLLVQYINTYSPAGVPQAAPAPVNNPQPAQPAPAGVPLTEVQGVVENREKPLTADEIRKLIKEELGEKKETPVIVNLPAQEKKPEEPSLTKEDISKIVADELKAALKESEPKEEPEEEEPEVVVEPTPVASLSAEDIRLIISEELTAAKDQADEEARKKAEEEAAEKKAEEEKKKAEKPEPSVRDVIKEELAAYHAQEEAEKQKALEEQKKAEEAKQAEEAKKAAAKKPEEPVAPEGKKAEEKPEEKPAALTPDEIRKIIAEEFAKQQPKPEEKPAEEEKKLTAEDIRNVIKEELAGILASNKKEEVKPVAESKPVPAPAPVVVVVNSDKKEAAVVAPAPAKEEPVKRVVGAVNPNLPPHPKIIRIPFPTRMLGADKALQNNYNELKSDIMAYGVKSRVSNSGDTFRLHKVTYVKLTIAGKGLKLYYALNPQDYANTTLPIQDAGHKSIYKEIPLVFKVKSDLSLRRAKQLVADVMAKGGLEQGKIEPNNWAAALKDYKDQGEDDDD